MILEFQANDFEFDDIALRIGFSDQEHYFIMQREEESVEEALPNLENIYIERDEQGWGGYGGISQVKLEQNRLIIELNGEIADIMEGYNTIIMNFCLDNWQFLKLQKVLNKIMYGYEPNFHVIT